METSEEKVKKIKKSEWKRELKRKIEEIVQKEMEEQRVKMTKLRFIQRFERQEYVKECRMEKVRKIMQMRLNMTELKANFKGKYDDTKCPACGKEEETTEHVITCNEYQKISGHTMSITGDITDEMNSTSWMKRGL